MAPFPQKHLMAHEKPENRIGRPSEYRPEYCQAVIDYMGQGYSLTAFAGSIRVSRNAVYEWCRAHQAFGDAVARARPARVAALETKLLRSRKGAETSAAMFALKNADPTEWRDLKNDPAQSQPRRCDADRRATIRHCQRQERGRWHCD